MKLSNGLNYHDKAVKLLIRQDEKKNQGGPRQCLSSIILLYHWLEVQELLQTSICLFDIYTDEAWKAIIIIIIISSISISMTW